MNLSKKSIAVISKSWAATHNCHNQIIWQILWYCKKVLDTPDCIFKNDLLDVPYKVELSN
jgi:hypothetical protein